MLHTSTNRLMGYLSSSWIMLMPFVDDWHSLNQLRSFMNSADNSVLPMGEGWGVRVANILLRKNVASLYHWEMLRSLQRRTLSCCQVAGDMWVYSAVRSAI